VRCDAISTWLKWRNGPPGAERGKWSFASGNGGDGLACDGHSLIPLPMFRTMRALPALAASLLLVAACGRREEAASPPFPERHSPTTFLIYEAETAGFRETVTAYVVSTIEIAVIRSTGPCAAARYHSAVFDPVSREPETVTLGRLTPEATQARDLIIRTQRRADRLELSGADGTPAGMVAAPPWPFLLSDLRLADWVLTGPRGPEARHGFPFGLAESDGGIARSPSLFARGEIRAVFRGAARGPDGGMQNMFDLERVSDGAAFGHLMTDLIYGHVVEAEIGAPGQSTRIRLSGSGRGRAEFFERLFSLFEGC